MADSEELAVLKEVARRLNRAKISYMVTGSIAANFYTVPRMTRDIDIVVELSDRDISRFIALFQNDFYLEPRTVREAVKARECLTSFRTSMSSRWISLCARTANTGERNLREEERSP